MPTEMLWRFAMAAIPLAIVVAVLTRWLPCRPATRHTLWLTVLLWLVAAPLLPSAPSLGIGDAVRAELGATEFSAAVATTDRHSSSAPTPETDTDPEAFVGESTDSPNLSSRRSVARLRLDRGPTSPSRLAQATGTGGPLTLLRERDLGFANTARPHVGRAVPPDSTSFLADREIRRPLSVRDRTFAALSRPSQLPARSRTPAAPLSVGNAPRIPGAIADVPPTKDGTRWLPTAWREWVGGLLAVRQAITNLPAIPPGVWLGGAIVLAGLAVVRTLRFRALLETARPAPHSVRRLVREAGMTIGLRRVPEVVMIHSRVSPMIWCGRRLRLVLPVSLWRELDEAGRRAVVFHELAHVRRRDHWVSWADSVVGLCYWWYPLVWWVRGRVRAEAEHCCDAWVTSLLPSERRAYAEALLRTKQSIREEPRWMSAVGMGMATGRAERFARRLTMVMTTSTKPRLSASGITLVMTLAMMGWLVTPAQSDPPPAPSMPVFAPTPTTQPAPPSVAALPTPTTFAFGTVPAAVTAPAVVVGLGHPNCDCEKCAHKHQGEKHKIGTKCKSCKDGKPCASCKKAKPCFDGHGISADMGDFAQHLAHKVRQEAHEGTLRNARARAAVGKALGKARARLNDVDAEDVHERMRQLERRLERLGEEIAKITETAVRSGIERAPMVDHGRRATIERELREMREPRAPRAPRAPQAPRAPRAPRAPQPPALIDELFVAPDSEGETTSRMYHLPAGKLEALTALMIRSDVPVVVSPSADGIELHGTESQHRIFKAFIAMIHPNDDGRSDASPTPFDVEVAPERLAAGIALVEAGAPDADELRRTIEDTVSAHQAQMALEFAHAADEAQIQAEQFRAQLAAMSRQSEMIEEQADGMHQAADEMREQADELREKAEEVKSQTSDMEKSERDAAKATARELAVQARQLAQEARRLDREAERMEQEAARVAEKAQQIEERRDRDGDEDDD